MGPLRKAKGLPHIRRHSRRFLCRSCCEKKLWRRNDELVTQDRFQNAISFARFRLDFCRDDLRANAFDFAVAVPRVLEIAGKQTGQPGRWESVWSGIGAATAGWNDRLRCKRPALQTDAGNVRRRRDIAGAKASHAAQKARCVRTWR